jgi:hypothetical protein
MATLKDVLDTAYKCRAVLTTKKKNENLDSYSEYKLPLKNKIPVILHLRSLSFVAITNSMLKNKTRKREVSL